MAQVETDRGKEQRKGNGECHDNRAANIAQEEKENDRNQDHSLRQIVLDRFDGEGDEIRTIEERDYLHALGQNIGVELLYFLMDALQDRSEERRVGKEGRS